MENAQDHLHKSFHDNRLLVKVPQITLYFWIIKVLCTTVGETFADYLNDTLGFGLTKTTIVMVAALIVALVFQFRSKTYQPALYWLVVVLISVAGTLFTDNLSDGFNVPLTTSTPVFAVILGMVFWAWYRSERTLSIHSIFTNRREAYYWLTILFTFALGTAVGDLIAEKFNLGYAVSFYLFFGVTALFAALWHFKVVNPVLGFWSVYVMTRPLGASIGDQMSQSDPKAGGWGLGTTNTSYIFLSAILLLVIFLSVTKRNQIELSSE